MRPRYSPRGPSLRSMMRSEFVVFEGDDTQRLIPDIATERLRQELLPSPNVFSYQFGIDVVVPDIVGFDPVEVAPQGERFVYTQGWVDGNAEALLVITQLEDEGYYWQGIILDRDGF